MSQSLTPLLLEPQYCRQRQQRLLAVMERLRLDRVILGQPEHVQYFTGFRPGGLLLAAVAIDADGRTTLAAPNSEPEGAAADEIVTFEAQWHSTLRQEQRQASIDALMNALGDTTRVKQMGVEFSNGARYLDASCREAELVDIEPNLWALRRAKDPDELAMIRRAVACTEAMYARAREVIEPGVTELALYQQLHSAAVDVAGEPLTGFGNDFQCNSPGGPPRNRPAQSGELFVLDLGPGYRGYYADNCRTMLVDGSPSDDQQRAWEAIVGVLNMVQRTVKPGVSARGLFKEAQRQLDEYRPGAFFHHLGHGFGLYPHEGPHLNPHWDDTFAVGDVFTAEPGLYGPELRAGIRLEENYLVTETGVERLTSYPLEL